MRILPLPVQPLPGRLAMFPQMLKSIPNQADQLDCLQICWLLTGAFPEDSWEKGSVMYLDPQWGFFVVV